MVLPNDCIILDGATCGRVLASVRARFTHWREIQLRRVDPSAAPGVACADGWSSCLQRDRHLRKRSNRFWGNRSEISPLVADNASTDGTQDIARYAARTRVRYQRNEANIGLAANFASFSACRTAYPLGNVVMSSCPTF